MIVTLRLSDLGSWGPGCEISQVYKQAREAALRRILKAFEGSNGGVKLVGDVTVKVLTTEVEQRP